MRRKSTDVTGPTPHSITVTIGGLPIAIHTASAKFIRLIESRYAGFVAAPQAPRPARFQALPIRLEVEVIPTSNLRTNHDPDADLDVRLAAGCWRLRRGDFTAEWEPDTRRGRVRQAAYPYAIDSVIRVVHSLVLAESGGFLLHAASAVRNGRAFLFSGVSEAGKTTLSRLAPPDVTLLGDEISYVRPGADGYQAFGTPFAGELGVPGENIAAPIAALYFLAKGREHRIRPLSTATAAQRLLRNILFFADDRALVERLFQTACDFVARVHTCELAFRPEAEVWELIR
ncbi:MAG: hypothetical protein U0587_20050 [Candidatus Binatia bacterium]